jgi:hypothetical protein
MRAERTRGNARGRTFVVVLFAVLVATCATVVPGADAQGGGARNCGPVAPPLPAGLHEGYSFFKVTARHLGCGKARRVARRYVELTNHSTPPLPVDRTVFGFACKAPPSVGPARCRRGWSVVVGYNGGF